MPRQPPRSGVLKAMISINAVDASRVLSHLERPDAPLKRRAGACHQHQQAVPMTDSSHSMNLRGARPGVSVTQLRRRANVYDFTS
jgi:hypothetical protein